MKIALIWPKGFDPIYVMPISLGYLAGNMPEHHEVKVFDNTLSGLKADSFRFRESLSEFNPQVVGISCWSTTYLEGLSIAEIVRSIGPRIITVMGGAHATTYFDKVMENKTIDFVFRGEAEQSFPVFIEELGKGRPDLEKVFGLVYRDTHGMLKKNEMHREENLDKISIPDYDAVNLEGYLRSGYKFNTKHKLNAPVWVTRGCPYRCGFCTAPLMNGKTVRSHSVEYMVEWVKYLYYKKGIKLINIIDDNFTFYVDYAKNFCRAMIALNIKDLYFNTPNGIRVQKSDAELFELMKKAGWENVVIAPESGSPKTLKRMQKDLDPEIIFNKVQEIKDAKLKVHGFFVIGYPGETIEDIKMTEKLLRKCKFNMIFLNNFQPLPGTPIYNELVASGEIKDGLLPTNYSGGERVYTPAGLKDFNFPRFVLLNYLNIILRDPGNFFYILSMFDMRILINKIISNLKNMFGSPGPGDE